MDMWMIQIGLWMRELWPMQSEVLQKIDLVKSVVIAQDESFAEPKLS